MYFVTALVAFRRPVDRERQAQRLVPAGKVFAEEHIVQALEADDHVLALRIGRCGKRVDDATDRRDAGSAGNDDLARLVEAYIEAIAEGPAQEELLAHIVLEDLVRDPADTADCEVDGLAGHEPETEIGASPNFGTDTSKNWPGRTSPSYAILNVYSFFVCLITSRISDKKGMMAAAIALGAEGIEMGTAFLCAEECTIVPATKQAIVDAGDMRSRITAESIMEPCRQLRNAFTDRMEDLELNHPVSEVADEMRRLAGPSLRRAMHDGDTKNGAVMAGQAAPLIKSIRPAAEIVDSTIDEFRHIASKMGSFDLGA